jgi:diaminopimelate decarboxylase
MLWPETTRRDDQGRIEIGGVPLTTLASAYGTPLYVFDEVTLRNRARRIVAAMCAAYPKTKVFYAGKAFLSPALVRILHAEGLSLDVVSGGELYGGLLAGIPPAEITFHGNNKSVTELKEAIAAGVGHIAVDNDLELDHLADLTKHTDAKVPILLRLNPGIDVHTHEKIKTGAIDSKFGFPLWTGHAERAAARAVQIPGVDMCGYHVHLGSQLFDPDAARLAVEMLFAFAAKIERTYGAKTKMISTGGGFGIAYGEDNEESRFESWSKAIGATALAAADAEGIEPPELTVEPGRYIVGPSAVALYEVGSEKNIPDVRHYVSVDGGMADNVRPSLYGAVYTAEVANRAAGPAVETVTIAGKYCESGDVLIKEIAMPKLIPGDLLAMPAAGAYALPLASNYNASTRPAVVIVNDGEARLIKRRETYADVFAADVIEPDR